jgi:hypothetical protein
MAEADENKAVQTTHKQADDAQRRADGQAFDERMREFTADPPRAPRSAQERRGKR